MRPNDKFALPVTDENPAAPAAPSRRRLLTATYLAAAALGLLVGRQAVLLGTEDGQSTSLTRVGFALQDEASAQSQPADWAALRADVDYVRQKVNGQTSGVFDLVVAVRGLDNGGIPDWAKAEQLCRRLNWPTCA